MALRAKGAPAEWQVLMHTLRADVWKEEFDAFGSQARHRVEWQAAVGRARATLDVLVSGT